MKKLLLFQLLIFVQFTLFAEKVSVEQAEIAAENHYKLMYESIKGKTPAVLDMNLSLVYTLSSEFSVPSIGQTEEALFYVYNVIDGNGFVILSADNNIVPVIGYSLESTFTGTDMPPGLSFMINQYAHEIDYAISNGIPGDENVSQSWSNILEGNPSSNFKSISSVDPLCATTWNQAPYYNDLCPYDNSYNELTVTGCPATAMAQIMKYWNYPATGTGNHSYNHDTYGTLSANFAAETYNWTAMPNSINGSNSAIAVLNYHCGIGVEMNYGVAATGGSGGYVIEDASPIQHCCEYAFKNYFGYKTSMHGELRENYTNVTWMSMLQSDLDAGKPIQYAGFGQGGGHTWVCDGYDNSNYFHMNWGWGGVYDGYFSLDNLSPGTGGAGGGSGSFSSGQQALMGIEPNEGGNPGGGTFDLRAYSNITIGPNPINFTEAFDVTVDVGNFDDSNFSGGLAAALFNSEGDFIEFIEELGSVSIQIGFYNTYTFHTDGLLATPGEYFVGIYYKVSGGEYDIIGAGEFTNYASTSIVGPDNTMQLYSDIAISPQTITSNESFQLVFDIANLGPSTFDGDVSADLYDSEGEYLYELAILTIQLESNFYGTITLDCPGVDVEPGSYLLAIWDLPSGGNWNLVGSDDFPNPIAVQIAAQQVQPDMYENNDEEILSYSLSYSGGTQETINTNGSNIHEGNDMDFYMIDLPAGSQYKFITRAHDSYNSGNGISYTDDVLWAYKAGGDWSDTYDDVMDGFFVVNGGQSVYFVVSNYYQGSTGNYLLEMQVEKGSFGIDELNDPDFISIYPNPSKSDVHISSQNWSELGLPLDIEIINMQGQKVYELESVIPETADYKLDLPDLPSGQYYLRLNGKQFYYDKKIIITD